MQSTSDESTMSVRKYRRVDKKGLDTSSSSTLDDDLSSVLDSTSFKPIRNTINKHSVNFSEISNALDSLSAAKIKTRLHNLDMNETQQSQDDVNHIEQELTEFIETSASHITRLAPGLTLVLTPSTQLPLLDGYELCEYDCKLLTDWFGKSRSNINQLLPLYIQLIQNKHCMLDQIFYSACCKSSVENSSFIDNIVHILTECYDCIHDLSTWRINYKLINKALNILVGYSENTKIIEHNQTFTFNKGDDYEISSAVPRIEMLANTLQHVLHYDRCELSCDEIVSLIISFSHLSINRGCYRSEVQSLIGIVINKLLEKLSEQEYIEVESNLCSKLLTLTSHHHNHLHLVRIIPKSGTRSCDFRQTLSYVILYSLVYTTDEPPSEWTLDDLYDVWSEIIIDDSSNMYVLYTLINLLDECIGHTAQPQDKDILMEITESVKKSVHNLLDNLLKPDLKKVKHLLDYLSYRWTWLINSVQDDLQAILGLRSSNRSPYKFSVVCSQETGSADILDTSGISEEQDSPVMETHKERPVTPEVQESDSVVELKEFVNSLTKNMSPAIRKVSQYSKSNISAAVSGEEADRNKVKIHLFKANSPVERDRLHLHCEQDSLPDLDD